MIELLQLTRGLDLPTDPAPLPDSSPAQQRRQAAVAVVVRPAPAGPEILLIKRSASDRDPWSGHMAFPGGKHEPEDVHLLDTARRETVEETGLVLPEMPPEWIGRLPEVSPRGRGSTLLPPLVVSPFLFMVPSGALARVASHEVEQIHWVSMADLADPAREGVYRMPIGGAVRSFPAFDVGGEQVWGLTWRVLTGLLARLD